MAGKVKPIPEGYHTLTPHIVVSDGNAAIEFYKKAFGAEEEYRTSGPEGKIVHAALRIGDSMLMLCDEFPEMGARSPKSLGASPVSLHVYCPDANAVMKKAEAAGAQVTMPVQDTFWGDRYGRLTDPFGHTWSIATHVEDLAPDVIRERAAKAMSQGGCGESGGQ